MKTSVTTNSCFCRYRSKVSVPKRWQFLRGERDKRPISWRTSTAPAMLILSGPTGQYAAAVRVETRIVGSRTEDAIPIRLGIGPDAAKVVLTDEQVVDRWPLDYSNSHEESEVARYWTSAE